MQEKPTLALSCLPATIYTIAEALLMLRVQTCLVPSPCLFSVTLHSLSSEQRRSLECTLCTTAGHLLSGKPGQGNCFSGVIAGRCSKVHSNIVSDVYIKVLSVEYKYCTVLRKSSTHSLHHLPEIFLKTNDYNVCYKI